MVQLPTTSTGGVMTIVHLNIKITTMVTHHTGVTPHPMLILPAHVNTAQYTKTIKVEIIMINLLSPYEIGLMS